MTHAPLPTPRPSRRNWAAWATCSAEMAALTVTAALASVPAWASEAPLSLQGPGPYVTLEVPLAVRSQARTASLSDLQVLNARGEVLPFAWAWQPLASQPETTEQAVPFFKAPAVASAPNKAAPPGLQGGWIFDARKATGSLTALQLTLPPGTHGVYSLVLEHSTDLQRWQPVREDLQLLSLQQQGQQLDNTRIELDGLGRGYLRLRPQAGSPLPPVSGARLSTVRYDVPPSPWQWSDEIAPSRCTPQACDYTLPRHLPLERLELKLATANTLAPLQLWVPLEAGHTAPPERRHHRLRDTLRGVRDKSAPPPTAAEPGWYLLHDTTAYWLRLPEGEFRSPVLEGDGGLHPQLRLQPQGGMAQLGATPPRLRVAARPRTLVFLAREPAPYRLSWGGADGTPLGLQALMPMRRSGEALPTTVAQVTLPPPPAASNASSAAASSPAGTAPTAAAQPAADRKPWLWGALLLALALMGAMAWSLLKPTARSSETT